MINSAKNQENTNTQFTFAPLPNWLLKRKEISLGAKAVYARLLQYKGKNDYAYPKRQTLSEELGIQIRVVDRFINELTNNNLIVVKHVGCNRPNEYSFPTHIWMKSAQTYECTKVDTPECTKTYTPYKDENIIRKYNIIHKKNNALVSEKIPIPNLKEKFEEWWMAYPRKLEKKKAFSEFCRALDQTDFETLMRKARTYARMRDKITDSKPEQEIFTKYAHKWLADFGWEDHYGRNEIEPVIYSQASGLDMFNEKNPYQSFNRTIEPKRRTQEEIDRVDRLLREAGIKRCAA